MQVHYSRSIWSASDISAFDLPAGFHLLHIIMSQCLWATAELQDSRLPGPSFQLWNPEFLPGTVILVIWRQDHWPGF